MQKTLTLALCVLAGSSFACEDDLPSHLPNPFGSSSASSHARTAYPSASLRMDETWNRQQAQQAEAYERQRPITVIDHTDDGATVQTWYPSLDGRVYNRY